MRAEGLLDASSARFSVKRCGSCKGFGSLLSYPLPVATLSCNPIKGLQTNDQQIWAEWGGTAAMYTASKRIHLRSVAGHRTWTSLLLSYLYSDSCVDDGYCLRLWSVWRSPFTYFPLSQVELCLAVREKKWLRAAKHDRWFPPPPPPRYHADFLLSRRTSVLKTLLAALVLWLILEEKETSTNRQSSKVSSHDCRSASLYHSACFRALRDSRPTQSSWQRRDFFSNRRGQYRPHTQPNVADCWPWWAMRQKTPLKNFVWCQPPTMRKQYHSTKSLSQY